ncbi:helix-turn-helix domain-containing protein [Streptomyces sp. NBC_01511]|uniref:helix-turn-helix domain-containing protein n=1 Tax=unclassified Streptomyces TaxID=2593676 RepID=UPI00386CEE8D
MEQEESDARRADAHQDPGFAHRAASLLRAAANDLKRDEESADRDLGLEPGTFARYVGERPPVDWELIRRAAQVWPLNERDLLPVRDDCPDGVRIHRLKDSVASARILARGGVDYYEYRDTAMSRGASYRPEWIRMLQAVTDDDPDNPLVRWNQGHLLYQFTYFVGPVNYYYEWGGERRCVPMDTGDSVWGLPFAPHTFTARETDRPAYILALTYGGDLVGDAQRELAVLGARTARQLALPAHDPDTAGARLLASALASRALTVAEAADRSGLKEARISALLDGAGRPTAEELDLLATALGVSPRDLLPVRSTTDGGVVLRRAADSRRWLHPDPAAPSYRVRELATDPLHPHTSALELDVLAGRGDRAAPLTTHQHQYAYVLGDAPAELVWRRDGTEYREELGPGDSVYVQPQVPLAFTAADGEDPRVLLLRIGGAVGPEVRFALGAMAEGGINRYIAEDRLWYVKEKGKQ